MPTKPSRARKWLKSGKAKVVYNDLGIFAVRLVSEPSDTQTQSIFVGIDPGKRYTGIGVQSAKVTLWMAHLQSVLCQKSPVVEALHGVNRRAFNWIVKSPREVLHLGRPQDRTRSPIEGVDLTAIPLHPAPLAGGVSREIR